MDPNLFDASLTGNVQLLNTLLQEDELVLDRIPLSCFKETPLHIASLRGHLDIVKIIVSKKPILAMSLDSLRRTALHLASAEGHVEIVRELLKVMNPDAWSFHDQDGRTPLHLASMNEQLDVIKVLIEVKPDLGRDLQENGETILHSCISCNRFEAMKLLSQLWSDEELAIQKDGNGNTLLHLAVVQKQIQTVKYLLEKPSIKATGNVVNGHGFTPLDVLDHCPQDLASLHVRSLLMEANFQKPKGDNHHFGPFQRSTKHKGEWMEKQRGILLLAAILVAVISFDSGLHPTGGTFTGSDDGDLGIAVQTKEDRGHLDSFLIQNTIVMVISLVFSLVLLSGIRLQNRFWLWVINVGTLYVVFFITVTFLTEIATMSPDTYVNGPTLLMCLAWMLLCILCAFIHTFFFVIWVIKKLLKARTKTRNTESVVV
ncbi:hypothetical protein LXL04_015527 [Taraxacum kok-saghyz]